MFFFFSFEDEFHLWISWKCPTFLLQPRQGKLEPHILLKFLWIAQVRPWDNFDLSFYHSRVLLHKSPCISNSTNPEIYEYFVNVRNLLLSPKFITYFLLFFFFFENQTFITYFLSVHCNIWIKAIQRHKFPLHKNSKTFNGMICS